MEEFYHPIANKRHERDLHVHIKEMHTHIKEIELKGEEDLKQHEEASKNGKKN
jgi:hypothetical protein